MWRFICYMKKKKQQEIIEVKEIKNPKRRLRLVIILMVIAAGFFAYGTISYLNRETGWEDINTNENTPLSQNIHLRYYLGRNANADYRNVTLTYTDTMKKASAIFLLDESKEYRNLYLLNHNVNKEVEIEPELYEVFEKFEKAGNRSYLLAPVYREYDKLFMCREDYEAKSFDPQYNENVRYYINDLITFINNPDHISLELKGNNKVILHVSNEYLNYAKDNDVVNFVDFYWYRNAIVADMVADALREKGYTNGYIATSDGYAIRMDGVNETLSTFIYDVDENNDVRDVATFSYDRPLTIVSFHNYTFNDAEGDYYYRYRDETWASGYIDPADGVNKTALNDLLLYSSTDGCLDILLKAADIYVSENFDTGRVKALVSDDIYSIYTIDRKIHATDKNAQITELFDKDGITYSLSFE